MKKTALIIVGHQDYSRELREQRAARIDALAPDRSRVPDERTLQPTPPNALTGDERIRHAREEAVARGEMRMDILKALLECADWGPVAVYDRGRHVRDIEIREPIPRR